MVTPLLVLSLVGLVATTSGLTARMHNPSKFMAQTGDRPWTADDDLAYPLAFDQIKSDHEAQGGQQNCIYSFNHPRAQTGLVTLSPINGQNVLENRFIQIRDDDASRSFARNLPLTPAQQAASDQGRALFDQDGSGVANNVQQNEADNPDFWYTLVVDFLPAGLTGAQGVNRGQIIIYEGDYLNRRVLATDPIVAFTSFREHSLVPLAADQANTAFSLCVFEASNNGRSEESSTGELILTYFTLTGAAPAIVATSGEAFRLARMTGDAPFALRLEHVGDAVFVDANGKFSFDVSGFYRDFDPTSVDSSA